jgi:hypothetical protein
VLGGGSVGQATSVTSANIGIQNCFIRVSCAKCAFEARPRSGFSE